MKFGRFHGLILMLLGFILLMGQAFLYFHGQGRVPSTTYGQSSPSRSENSGIPPIFGIMGGLVFGAGVVILLVSPNKSLKQELNAPDKK
jgi:hypothetical protein